MNKIKIIFLNLSVACLLFAAAFSASAQTARSAKNAFQTLKLNSKLMAREMPYRIILPIGYDAAKTERFSVIYLLHGLTGHFDNWTDKTKLAEYASNYRYIIVTPEGDNGWYTDSSTAANDKYESYIVQELIPEIDKNYRTFADKNHRSIAGLSMGGYGSIKFGLKYPEKFALVGSFSGALQAASFTDKTLGNSWKALTDSIMSVYGADGSETRQANDIYRLAKNVPAEKIKELPFIFVDCGTEDVLIGSNREFNLLLAEKKIPHEYRELPGIHNWVFWDSEVNEFLEMSVRFLK